MQNGDACIFNLDSQSNYLISNIKIDPSRSPFIQERLEVLYEDNSVENIMTMVKDININEATFKVVCLNSMDIGETKKILNQSVDYSNVR